MQAHAKLVQKLHARIADLRHSEDRCPSVKSNGARRIEASSGGAFAAKFTQEGPVRGQNLDAVIPCVSDKDDFCSASKARRAIEAALASPSDVTNFPLEDSTEVEYHERM
jgi:hypothetical protein